MARKLTGPLLWKDRIHRRRRFRRQIRCNLLRFALEAFLCVLLVFCVSSFELNGYRHPSPRKHHKHLVNKKNHPNIGETKLRAGAASFLTTLASAVSTIPTQATAISSAVDMVPPWSRTEIIVVASLLLPILLSACQAATAISKYRSNFGDAPSPRIPCHGVVLVQSNNLDSGDDSNNKSIVDLPDDDDCLRLLVIGDSLAVGIGQSTCCTPVLPEEIAKEISKGTGKAVFWTCAGESGASTQWITRMVRQWQVDLTDNADTNTLEQLEMSGSLLGKNENDKKESFTTTKPWRTKLDRYRALFDPENMRPYDIVVLLTGANDLKIMLLPFMLDKADKDLNQSKKDGGGLIDDLAVFIQTLNDKTETSVRILGDRLEQQFQKTVQEIRESVESLALALEVDIDGSLDQIFGADITIRSTSVRKNDLFEGDSCSVGSPTCLAPLFVLPGMPARAVPSLRDIPLKWLAVPVMDMMDRKKQNFAKTSPYNIIFVKDPALEDIIDYEEERGSIWTQRNQDDVLLSLRDIGKRECTAILEAMKSYYRSKGENTLDTDTPLSKRPNKPGTKCFSLDGIHPNEFGYIVWGKLYLAN